MPVPNQKIIQVQKQKCDKQNRYAMANLDAKRAAACILDAGAFKMWNYFSDNQDYYTFELSRAAVEQNYGIKKKQYDKAIQELIEKRYLIQIEGSNKYVFSETPLEQATWYQKDTTRDNGKIPQKNTQYQKDTTSQYQKDTTRGSEKILEILHNNTINNTGKGFAPSTQYPKVSKEEMSKILGEWIIKDGVAINTFTQRKYKVED